MKKKNYSFQLVYHLFNFMVLNVSILFLDVLISFKLEVHFLVVFNDGAVLSEVVLNDVLVNNLVHSIDVLWCKE